MNVTNKLQYTENILDLRTKQAGDFETAYLKAAEHISHSDEGNEEGVYDPSKAMFDFMLKQWAYKIVSGENEFEDNW